jgi:hypothetical protein
MMCRPPRTGPPCPKCARATCMEEGVIYSSNPPCEKARCINVECRHTFFVRQPRRPMSRPATGCAGHVWSEIYRRGYHNS